MVQIVKPDQRDMKLYDAPGARVQVSDPILGKDDCLAAGFTEYLAPSRLEVHAGGQEPVSFEVGDLGYIEKDTTTVITVPEGALLMHVTQPAWRE